MTVTIAAEALVRRAPTSDLAAVAAAKSKLAHSPALRTIQTKANHIEPNQNKRSVIVLSEDW
ncbi:hypothetical protein ACFL6C_13490, partial [Myxococcota bacterium]